MRLWKAGVERTFDRGHNFTGRWFPVPVPFQRVIHHPTLGSEYSEIHILKKKVQIQASERCPDWTEE
ncbi:hypothetical protein JR316_0007347 [Psilocybe cubensis]|uniref:Uncharacterized protein n=1 Tax=Psilocybe cubensis TaxID=181762 RepID=A0ACB8GZD9_PSICU|nr:hypothetical protein JR316_0007347 [Psilocybe cubensis]KAH9480747.1 hypothetical protein JR316_0007347 [Psilocybe cubensis]